MFRAYLIAFCIFTFSVFVRGAFADAPATQPAGVISGKVSAPSDIPNIEMVVYSRASRWNAVASSPACGGKSSQHGARFSPALTIITVGQRVDFVNDEEKLIEHNVFSNAPPKKFDLGMYPPGQSRSVIFDKPGAVMLYCSIHRYMDGVVFVTPSGLFSRVEKDGTYRIEGIPDGKWMLTTWQRRRRFKEITRPLTIEAGKSQTINLELTNK